MTSAASNSHLPLESLPQHIYYLLTIYTSNTPQTRTRTIFNPEKVVD